VWSALRLGRSDSSRRFNVIGYALGGLFLGGFVASLAGAVFGSPTLYWSGIAVAAVSTAAVCVGIARAARDA